jgi:uncharacterized membrane protein
MFMTKVAGSAYPQWRRPQFWRNVFLYFWCFSLIGHVVEITWALLGNWIGLRSTPASTIPIFAIAIPYGLGAVCLLLILYPLVQKKRINLFMAFVVGAFITTIIEFICAVLLVTFTGHNPFWNYSSRFMNLYGYICLSNSIMFGLGSVVALRWVFPWTEKILGRVRGRRINIVFWILFVSYILSQIYLRIIRS